MTTRNTYDGGINPNRPYTEFDIAEISSRIASAGTLREVISVLSDLADHNYAFQPGEKSRVLDPNQYKASTVLDTLRSINRGLERNDGFVDRDEVIRLIRSIPTVFGLQVRVAAVTGFTADLREEIALDEYNREPKESALKRIGKMFDKVLARK